MTATKVISDRFKVSGLLAGRLKEHQISVPAVLRRAGLPAGFFQQEKIYVEGTSPGEWRTRHRMAEAVA
jgi:hypothetical protein